MNKIIIVTDLGHLKAYQIRQDEMAPKPSVDLLKDVRFDEYQTRVSQRMTDKAGRFPAGAYGRGDSRAGFGEEHDEATEMERQQVEAVAQAVNQVCQECGCESLYLAVPQTVEERVVAQLSPDAADCLRKVIPQDLVKLPKLELLSRFGLAG